MRKYLYKNDLGHRINLINHINWWAMKKLKFRKLLDNYVIRLSQDQKRLEVLEGDPDYKINK